MKRLATALTATLATLALAVSAQADPSEYGFESVAAAIADSQAGAHANFTTDLRLVRDPATNEPPSTTEEFRFELPPGLLGNPLAVPPCTAAQIFDPLAIDPSGQHGCPQASQVGITEVEIITAGLHDVGALFEPVYRMVPLYGEPARLGFLAGTIPVLIDTKLRSDGDYGVTAKVARPSSFKVVLSAKTTLWDVPADASHDGQRINPFEGLYHNGEPDTPTGTRPAGIAPVPFMSSPVRCGVAQGVGFVAIPYQRPDLEATAFAPLSQNTACELLAFEPQMTIVPSTSQAETGSGLDVDLTFPSRGLEQPELLAGAIQKRAEVTLPKGVTVNPSQAVGLGVCSEEDFERETAFSLPNQGCPETSKIGSVTARSPLLDETAEGSLYIAKPKENPFGTLIALYLVLKVPERGVIVKLPGKVVPDPETGQLITTFGESGHEIPQLPVESFHLHFREGARAPLVTPPACGSYESTAKFTAWSGQVVTTHPTFQISSGVNGGPCPQGTPPFEPGFEAGAESDTARAFTPYYLRLTRKDGDQDLTRFSTTFPAGALAKLAGVSRCPQAQIEAAKSRTGTEELASPSCPATSEIGNVLAGAGVGQVLTYATGKIYLAGPYHGDPLSVVAIVPAVAGPFDVGTVVTQEALSLDPDTAQAQVDGAASDPIPHILAGIPLKVRDIRVYVDRPNFTLNPTNCEPLAFAAQLWGGGNDVFSTADDSPVSLSSRFQVANCANLGFKPRLSLKLKGGTKRGGHPALKAVVRPRAGDANFASAAVTLPHSAFLDQAHIRTICTRVQFAAGEGNGAQCPAGAVYGHAVAKTPLLDEPLEGPVYLRSSSHNLPDLVIALHGIVDINLASRIDSVRGGIRSTFEAIPDAPVTKFVLEMEGGQKGLIVNSADLCASTHRATAKLTGQNGRALTLHPALQAKCPKPHKKGKKKGKRHR